MGRITGIVVVTAVLAVLAPGRFGGGHHGALRWEGAPRTSVLGAILLTGYLGGAIASHVRIESPLFTHTLFGLYLGLMLWGGLWLRDANLRSLMPFRR